MVLKFTYKLNLNKKLQFLDVLVNTEYNEFKTTVYRKDTNMGICLNADSEFVDKYKKCHI